MFFFSFFINNTFITLLYFFFRRDIFPVTENHNDMKLADEGGQDTHIRNYERTLSSGINSLSLLDEGNLGAKNFMLSTSTGPDTPVPILFDETLPESLDVNSLLSILDSLFEKLKSDNEHTRTVAASYFGSFLLSITREISMERFQLFTNYNNNKITELINSSKPNENLAGILAVDVLVSFYSKISDTPSQTPKLTNYLRKLIPSNSDLVMRSAARTLGRLAGSSSSLSSDFVDMEVKTSLDWLTKTSEHTLSSAKQSLKKHASILVLSALAENAPYLIYPYVNLILDNLWQTLGDSNLNIRLDSATLVENCLIIIQKRDNALLLEWHQKLLDACTQRILPDSTDLTHGCLLIYEKLLVFRNPYLRESFDEIFQSVWACRDSRADFVRQELYKIFSLLSSLDSQMFSSLYLNQVMIDYLSKFQDINHNSKSIYAVDMPHLLTSIGDIAFQVKGELVPYLLSIVGILEEKLKIKYKIRQTYEREIFYCLRKLTVSLGMEMAKYYTNGLVDLMLACPLSDYMLETFNTINEEIPSMEAFITDKLSDLISFNLSGHRFYPSGSPNEPTEFSLEKARQWRDENELLRNGIDNTDSNDARILIQALNMVQTVKPNYSMGEFVSSVIILYIEHNDPSVRKLAATTACDLFVRDDICKQTSGHSLNMVSDVLSKLLTVAVADPLPDIRLEILKHLDSSFDVRLAEPNNLRILFTALNDEIFAIRNVTIKILGRLASVNPAYVVPPLRNMLLELLTELKCFKTPTRNEESLTLLCTLISSMKEVTKEYVEPIISILLTKACDKSAVVSSIAVKTIGELSVVRGEEMKPYLAQIMPLIISTFQDQSNTYKRDTALRALGQLASASNYVIDPLIDYPELLNVLINILRSDTLQSVKRETVRLIGILGAVDPYKYREVEGSRSLEISLEQNAPPIDISLLMQNISPSSDEYNPTVVITSLLKILKDPSLAVHHSAAIQTILNIYRLLGLDCVSFLEQVIPVFVSTINNSPQSLLEFYFKELGSLISIVKQHIRPYVSDIYSMIKTFFSISKIQPTVISVIESISKSIGGEIKPFVPSILTLFLDVLDTHKPENNNVSICIMRCLVTLGVNLEDDYHLILPSVIRCAEISSGDLRRNSIITIGKLARVIDISDMSSRIVQTFVRILAADVVNSAEVIMNTFCILLLRLQADFTVFIPTINRVLIRTGTSHGVYDVLVNKLLKNEPLPETVVLDATTEVEDNSSPQIEPPVEKLPINQPLLKSTWDCSQQRTQDDWQEWIKRLSIQFLKESPSHCLRACTGLATVYYPLAKDLFNSSFASIWPELYTQYQEDLIKSLCIALSAPQNPPEIHQTLLNLVEFMEHDDKPLPIPSQNLGEYAERCHAYAKALRFKEIKFVQEPIDKSIIESLISINNEIYQNDSAIGILKYVQKHHNIQLQETWYEKLQRWEDALQAYSNRIEAGDNSDEVVMGQMRSLHALSDWDSLSALAAQRWPTANSSARRAMAPLAAGASWSLGEWSKLQTYIKAMKPLSPDREFFSAVLSLHVSNFEDAQKHIFNARDLLVTEMAALINESYNRAYSVVVRSQLITELEEIIQFKKLPPNSEKRTLLRNIWDKRLLGCQKSVGVWQRILKVRSLVIKPKQDVSIWIKFANLCRKAGKFNLAEKALNSLYEGSDLSQLIPLKVPSKTPYPVIYAQLKFLWASKSKKEALRYLIGFTSRMAHDLGLDPSNMIAQNISRSGTLSTGYVQDYTKLLARCFLKQGEWRIALQPNWTVENSDAILGSYLLATHFDKNWYKAWHNWALANFEVIYSITSKQKSGTDGGASPMEDNAADTIIGGESFSGDEKTYSSELIQRHVVPAIKGFFHSISLSRANSLQDTLRLLTLWFTFGGAPEASKAMHEGFRMIKIDNWLEVLPQLISRIHQPNMVVSKSLLALLSDLGKAHPQVMMNPLIVAIKSESVSRQMAALSIVEKMRLHSPVLVDQSELVSNELIRVAVLWHELWYEGLEDASRQFFGEHNVEKMFATLEPLYELLRREPETVRESAFQNSFKRNLNDAYEWVKNYKSTKDIANLNQAWDIYYNIFRRISRMLPQLQTLDLQDVSPKLLAVHDLEVAVFGTYTVGKPVIKISYFDPIFNVISSKQRPRKFSVRGSDGKDYQYVLKGHEDIRQDSLVMQLFGLVNTLLEYDPECFQRHLDIQRYPAIPLSPRSGLLGWVPNSDTFHVLIREHRDANKVPLNIEHWVMLQMAPDYENLTLLQKIEVFQYAMENTKGLDLAQVLWLKSRSSESWLERRTVYTRSLAVMSMVGYILGLGDRHPSNLMLDKNTGKVIHIDFGDCFEAAVLREKFPEKVPFRLTRMLVNAMEVSGVEGSFRITCENVIRVLRHNKESLMAILEAFAFDPLIHWGFALPTEKIIKETGINLNLTNPSELLRRGTITASDAKKMEAEQQIRIRNARAVLLLRRITDKLTGNDFAMFHELDIPGQVDKLIRQATSIENLCRHYVGWCPFW